MTDEPKTLEEKTLNEVKSILTTLNTQTSWVKSHIAWIIGLAALVVGLLAGYFIRLHH